MNNSKFRKLMSFFLALALVLGMTSMASFAAPSPLFEINDAQTRQGEEFEIVVKFSRSILDTLAALDVTLSFDSNVYSVVSMENGEGLNAAFDKINSSDSNLENDYIFSTSAKNPGEVNWSLITLKSFTFYEGDEFMKIRFKANDLSDLNRELDMTIRVTNAAKPETLQDVTADFGSYTNNMEVEANLATMCDWEYVEALGGYRLVKFNGKDVESFTIPEEYDDPSDEKGSLPVVSIKNDAFRDNKTLKKVSLGKNIANVGSAAFFRCEALEKIVVFSKTTKFGANSLYGTSEDLVVKCLENSDADVYAKKYEIKVEYFENVADCTYTGADEKVYYTGAPVELSNLKVYNSKNQLMKLGVDYVVYYTDNIEIGTAKLMITGRGEYLGTKEAEFEILCPYHSADHACYTEQFVYTDCEVGGYIIKDCTFCELHDETSVIPAKEHGETVEVVDPDSTCSQVGVKKFVCKDCYKEVAEQEEIPVKPHTAPEEDVWEVHTPAACGVAGKEVVYCVDCDHILKEREIPAIEEHSLDWVVTTAPTCNDPGVETYKCRYCDYFEGEEAQTRSVDATGHTESEWIETTALSCTVDGVKIKFCTVCNEKLDEDVTSSNGHTAGEWEVVTKRTCTQDGLEKLHCAECNEVYDTRTLEHEGHKKGKTVTVAATCARPGSEDTYCSVCEEVYESKPLPILAHTAGDWEVVAEPTCTVVGLKHKVCQVCGEAAETQEIEAVGHNIVRTTAVLPSYKTQGVDELSCSICGKVERSFYTAKLNPDIDGKNGVTAADALVILQHATGLKDLQGEMLRNANLDGYGTVNSSDALIVLQISTGLIKV